MRKLALLLVSLFAFGCAISPNYGEVGIRDFNKDFQKNLPVNPQYKVEKIDENSFHIAIHQGSILISEKSTRANYLKLAGKTVAKDICEKENKKLGVIDLQQEGEIGWVHVTGTFACNEAKTLKSPSPIISQITPESPERKPVPGGTGFLFSSKDYIITNYHIVKGKHSIKAKFTNGDVIEADIVSKDTKNDIAILKLKTPSSTTSRELQFGDSSKARMGERVFTIGFPASFVLGERPKYTEGVISAVTGIKDDPTVFQITVPIQPGNSGGPLFNQRGEVIGITTASLSLRATEVLGAVPQNINYALKSSFVKNLLTSIPESLLSNRGIVVVPKDPENSLTDFIEAVTGNVVLIEAKE